VWLSLITVVDGKFFSKSPGNFFKADIPCMRVFHELLYRIQSVFRVYFLGLFPEGLREKDISIHDLVDFRYFLDFYFYVFFLQLYPLIYVWLAALANQSKTEKHHENQEKRNLTN